MATIQDAVCGMMVEPAEAGGSANFAGKTFYFCSVDCKRKFEAEPEEYASGRKRSPMEES